MEDLRQIEPRGEHTPDLVAQRKEVLQDLRGTAWNMDTRRPEVPPNWIIFPLENGGIVSLDPTQIAFDRLKALPLTGEDLASRRKRVSKLLTSWQYLGSMHGESADLFIIPRLGQLNYKHLPGVQLREESANPSERLQIGTLEFRAAPITPTNVLELSYFMPTEIEWNTTALLGMIRKYAPTNAVMQRNPQIAEPGFLREFKLGLRQLQAIGFSHAIGHPSDYRRARIYEKLGMEMAHNEVGDDYTWLDLKHLPPRLRS